ncbi:MAG: hypothetical protein IKQ94_01845 [Bacteroidales bacterium]|nr:hypothetical protein [Bacteroidales bacterium]
MITFKEYCNGQGRLDERMDTIPEGDMLMEMATIRKDNLWGGDHFRVAVHGPLKNELNTPKDRCEPHIHIYLTLDVQPYTMFDFEVSLVDIFAKGEYNLLSQVDRFTKDKFVDKRQDNDCSWKGYRHILKGLKQLLKANAPGVKNDVECLDNLQYCIESYNEESNIMTPNPFLDYIAEHNKELLQLSTFQSNLKRYYPATYDEWYDKK